VGAVLRGPVKISTGHAHTPTENHTPDTDTHTHTTRTTPQTNTSHKHSTTLEGGATTVRATSHARGMEREGGEGGGYVFGEEVS